MINQPHHPKPTNPQRVLSAQPLTSCPETAGLVLACVSELFIVVSVVVLLTTTGFGPRQSELSAEELAKRMEAAENGDAEAQCLLADAYFLGNGMEQDHDGFHVV